MIEQLFHLNAHPSKEAPLPDFKKVYKKTPERFFILFGLTIKSYIQMAINIYSATIILNNGSMRIA